MENVQSGILLILLTTLERNLITLHRSRGTFKLLTKLTILQTIHLPALALFLHLILAKWWNQALKSLSVAIVIMISYRGK